MSQENVEVVRDLFDRFNAFMRVELTSAAYAERRANVPDTPQHLLGGAEVIAFTEDYRSGWGERPAFALRVTAEGEIEPAPVDQVGG